MWVTRDGRSGDLCDALSPSLSLQDFRNTSRTSLWHPRRRNLKDENARECGGLGCRVWKLGSVECEGDTLWHRRDSSTMVIMEYDRWDRWMFNRTAETKVSIFPEWFVAHASGCTVIVSLVRLISSSSLKVELDMSIKITIRLGISAKNLTLYQSISCPCSDSGSLTYERTRGRISWSSRFSSTRMIVREDFFWDMLFGSLIDILDRTAPIAENPHWALKLVHDPWTYLMYTMIVILTRYYHVVIQKHIVNQESYAIQWWARWTSFETRVQGRRLSDYDPTLREQRGRSFFVPSCSSSWSWILSVMGCKWYFRVRLRYCISRLLSSAADCSILESTWKIIYSDSEE